MMSKPNVPHPNVQTVPLERLALVHRTTDGAERDRASGPELAALLTGTRPEDRRGLFGASDIALSLKGLAVLVAAVGEHGDTDERISSALYVVELGLLALVPRIERFETLDREPADSYTAEIAPEVAS